jgi:hypothetical protein
MPNPNMGWLARYDHKSGERLGIKPVDEATGKPLKWNWDSPIVLSPHNSDRLYFGANKLFRSDDKGQSWTVVSPDLTRQIDRNKLKIMGRVWSVDAIAKNKSTSFYGTLVALDESPLTEGLLYTGSDDGLIQRSDDGGKKWVKIDDYDLPEYVYVSCVIASSHKNDRVYASFDNHKMADFKPYVLMSDNKGKSWKNIAGNLPKNGTVWEVAEDPEVENLLFAGTEFGVFLPTIMVRTGNSLKRAFPQLLSRISRFKNARKISLWVLLAVAYTFSTIYRVCAIWPKMPISSPGMLIFSRFRMPCYTWKLTPAPAISAATTIRPATHPLVRPSLII